MTSQRTIIVVNDQANIVGGAAKVALSSAVELAKRNNRVILFSAVGPIDESLQSIPNLEIECLFQSDILRDPNRLRAATSGIWNRSAATALKKIIDRTRHENPVIHFHPWVKALSASVFFEARRSRIPSVITLHDYFSVCPTGGFLDSKTGEICKRKPLSLSCISCNCDPRHYYHKVWRVARGFVQNYVARCPSNCQHFITVSPYSEEILRPFLPAKATVDLIRYPIEVEQQPAIDPASSKDFLFVGRFSPEKGALDFAQAAIKAGLNAVFVGQGDEEQKIRDACPGARFLGWQSPAEVTRLMRSSRALVFPSRWYETQGLVAIEACAVGLPVIYSDVTVIASDLQDKQTGLSFQSRNVDDLARVMKSLADDDEFTRRIGRTAYDWYWSEPWTMTAHVERLEKLYDRIKTPVTTSNLRTAETAAI